MSKRFALPLLALIVLLAGLPAVALAAPAADPPSPERCRRLYGTDEWTRRCADSDADLIRYCRRAYGTDAWSRRCRQLFNDFDPIAYCRRIYGTELWTRRCLNLQPDPTPVVARELRGPRAIEPAVSVDAGHSSAPALIRPTATRP